MIIHSPPLIIGLRPGSPFKHPSDSGPIQLMSLQGYFRNCDGDLDLILLGPSTGFGRGAGGGLSVGFG